jgi:hypothetical protein
VENDFHVENLIVPLSLVWQHCSITLTRLAQQGVTLEKLYIFHTISDEDDLYMEIVALNEIYNFLV